MSLLMESQFKREKKNNIRDLFCIFSSSTNYELCKLSYFSLAQ